MSKLLRSYTESPAATLFTGMGTTIVGFLLITFYGDWQGNWTTVLLTVFGWLGLIKGLLLLATPTLFDGLAEWVANHNSLRFVSAVVSMIIGVVTLTAGFGWL